MAYQDGDQLVFRDEEAMRQFFRRTNPTTSYSHPEFVHLLFSTQDVFTVSHSNSVTAFTGKPALHVEWRKGMKPHEYFLTHEDTAQYFVRKED